MKLQNYILVLGIVLCGFVENCYAADRTLTIRHIILCLTTLSLVVGVCLNKHKDIKAFSTIPAVLFMLYCMLAILSMIPATNKAEALYSILIALVTLIFVICTSIVIDKNIVTKGVTYLALFLSVYGLYEIVTTTNILTVVGLGFTNGRNLWSSTLMLLLPFTLYQVFKKHSPVALAATLIICFDIIMLQTRSVYAAIAFASIIFISYTYKKFVIPFIFFIILCVIF